MGLRAGCRMNQLSPLAESRDDKMHCFLRRSAYAIRIKKLYRSIYWIEMYEVKKIKRDNQITVYPE